MDLTKSFYVKVKIELKDFESEFECEEICAEMDYSFTHKYINNAEIIDFEILT